MCNTALSGFWAFSYRENCILEGSRNDGTWLMLNRITPGCSVENRLQGSEAEISCEPIIIQARENGGLGQEEAKRVAENVGLFLQIRSREHRI